MDRIITMIIRQITNRLIRVGIDKGVEAVSNRGRDPQEPADPKAEKAQTQSQKDTARRAKQAMRLGRKISRF